MSFQLSIECRCEDTNLPTNRSTLTSKTQLHKYEMAAYIYLIFPHCSLPTLTSSFSVTYRVCFWYFFASLWPTEYRAFLLYGYAISEILSVVSLSTVQADETVFFWVKTRMKNYHVRSTMAIRLKHSDRVNRHYRRELARISTPYCYINRAHIV